MFNQLGIKMTGIKERKYPFQTGFSPNFIKKCTKMFSQTLFKEMFKILFYESIILFTFI